MWSVFGRWCISGALLLAVGCNCRGLPEDTSDTEEPVDETADTAPDTGVEPRCGWPEVEPNNQLADANELPLETWACGRFDTVGDGDQWRATTTDDGWLNVRIRSQAIGSPADPMLIITAPGGSVLERVTDDQSRDVTLMFPAPAGVYAVLARDRNGQGGDAYDYDLLASLGKAPLEWSLVEPLASNDARLDATPLPLGARLFGFIDAPLDNDWYRVDVPPGRRSLDVRIEAFAFGSPADTQFLVNNAAGNVLPNCSVNGCLFRSGPTGERDPVATLISQGDESLYLRVSEQASRGGAAYWYVISVEEVEP